MVFNDKNDFTVFRNQLLSRNLSLIAKHALERAGQLGNKYRYGVMFFTHDFVRLRHNAQKSPKLRQSEIRDIKNLRFITRSDILKEE